MGTMRPCRLAGYYPGLGYPVPYSSSVGSSGSVPGSDIAFFHRRSRGCESSGVPGWFCELSSSRLAPGDPGSADHRLLLFLGDWFGFSQNHTREISLVALGYGDCLGFEHLYQKDDSEPEGVSCVS